MERFANIERYPKIDVGNTLETCQTHTHTHMSPQAIRIEKFLINSHQSTTKSVHIFPYQMKSSHLYRPSKFWWEKKAAGVIQFDEPFYLST